MVERWLRSSEATYRSDAKVVCYLSAEFLTGPHLGNNLINLGIYDQAALGIKKTGLELETLLEHEPEPGLGNGGLGRLAACYLDSLATLEVPAIGYGIRYEFGIFNQGIRDGWQVEYTDKWLQLGNPWEIGRPEMSVEVRMGGRTEGYVDETGHFRVRWIADRAVRGFPMTPRSWATGSTPATCCGCGRPRPASPSIFSPSMSATITGRWMRRSLRKT